MKKNIIKEYIEYLDKLHHIYLNDEILKKQMEFTDYGFYSWLHNQENSKEIYKTLKIMNLYPEMKHFNALSLINDLFLTIVRIDRLSNESRLFNMLSDLKQYNYNKFKKELEKILKELNDFKFYKNIINDSEVIHEDLIKFTINQILVEKEKVLEKKFLKKMVNFTKQLKHNVQNLDTYVPMEKNEVNELILLLQKIREDKK